MDGIGDSSRVARSALAEVDPSNPQRLEVETVHPSSFQPLTTGVKKSPISLEEAKTLYNELKDLTNAIVATEQGSREYKELKGQFLTRIQREVHSKNFAIDNKLIAIRAKIAELILLVADPLSIESGETKDLGPLSSSKIATLTRSQVTELSEQDILFLSKDGFVALAKHIETQFVERIDKSSGKEIGEARDSYDNLVSFIAIAFQDSAPSKEINAMLAQMELKLILKGQLMDKTKESSIPYFTPAEIMALNEMEMVNLTKHLFNKVGDHIRDSAQAKKIYVDTMELIHQRYFEQELPAIINGEQEKLLNYAERFGVNLAD